MTIGELFKLTMDLPFRSFISSRKRKLKERKPSAKPLISSLLRVLLFKKSELTEHKEAPPYCGACGCEAFDKREALPQRHFIHIHDKRCRGSTKPPKDVPTSPF
jgi:hypothetical protein